MILCCLLLPSCSRLLNIFSWTTTLGSPTSCTAAVSATADAQALPPLLWCSYIATTLLSQIIANNSAAALMFPIAATISKNDGVDVSSEGVPGSGWRIC